MLQAFMVVFSSADPVEHDRVLPSKDELLEAFKEYHNIPNEHVLVDAYPVDIEAVGYDPTECRRCGNGVEEGRLFCNECANEIAEGECVEDSHDAE